MDGENRVLRRLKIPGWAYLALLGTALLYAWGSLFYRLSKFWFVDEDYQYGWTAPVLLVFMLYRRCKTLPPACRPMAGAAPFGAGWRAGDSWGSGPRQLGVSWVNCPHV